MKASILSIGTELTVGQITNRNSQWISQKLKEQGVETWAHLTVPDDRPLILHALKFLEPQTSILFVTGGLGPTSDDFTRDLVSAWAQEEMVFDEDSWVHIQNRLIPRGIPVREVQKQQCYFPKSAQVLFNDQGTANGFYLHVRGIDVFVLPGPPREIAAIWTSAVSHWLALKTADLDPLVTRSWDTMGLGESEIAALTEEALGPSKYERGYRVHLPYVEVKVSFLRSEQKAAEPFIQAVEKALAPYTWLRDGESSAEFFAEQIGRFNDLEIIDEVTHGFLWNRLKEIPSPALFSRKISVTNKAPEQSSFENQIHVKTSGFNRIEIRLRQGQQIKILHVESPYVLHTLHERRLQYFAELTLISVAKQLSL